MSTKIEGTNFGWGTNVGKNRGDKRRQRGLMLAKKRGHPSQGD